MKNQLIFIAVCVVFGLSVDQFYFNYTGFSLVIKSTDLTIAAITQEVSKYSSFHADWGDIDPQLYKWESEVFFKSLSSVFLILLLVHLTDLYSPEFHFSSAADVPYSFNLDFIVDNYTPISSLEFFRPVEWYIFAEICPYLKYKYYPTGMPLGDIYWFPDTTYQELESIGVFLQFSDSCCFELLCL